MAPTLDPSRPLGTLPTAPRIPPQQGTERRRGTTAPAHTQEKQVGRVTSKRAGARRAPPRGSCTAVAPPAPTAEDQEAAGTPKSATRTAAPSCRLAPLHTQTKKEQAGEHLPQKNMLKNGAEERPPQKNMHKNRAGERPSQKSMQKMGRSKGFRAIGRAPLGGSRARGTPPAPASRLAPPGSIGPRLSSHGNPPALPQQKAEEQQKTTDAEMRVHNKARRQMHHYEHLYQMQRKQHTEGTCRAPPGGS